MASSYFTESEAPRDFRVSSTDSDGHYTKCMLCYTVKKNFYCAECIKTGNFVHSSMPYTDRFAEKQMKLARVKANRKHILDRCEKLLSGKIRKDKLLTEFKQARDKLDLLSLAIEERKNNIEEKRKILTDLEQYNNELTLKLPRYQKRVSSLGKHTQVQRMELQNKINIYNDQAQSLASLRRSQIRQLTKYIFPVYLTYDTSESIEDMEFIGEDPEEESPRTSQLHIVAPWINTDGDYSHIQTWSSQTTAAGSVAAHRPRAALALAAQLIALLATLTDVRLPLPLQLAEYCTWRVSEGGVSRRARRLESQCAALCVRAGLSPPPHALTALHALAVAAHTDEPSLGRVEGWVSGELATAAATWWSTRTDHETEDTEPEHLHWPDEQEMEELSNTPPSAPTMATSIMTSIASVWRGWNK